MNEYTLPDWIDEFLEDENAPSCPSLTDDDLSLINYTEDQQ